MAKSNQEVEKLLWRLYEAELTLIKRNSWGKVYASRHKKLINDIKNYAKKLGIKKLKDKFQPLEREIE
jgi:hypothetical protein